MAGPRAARVLEGVDDALMWQFLSEAVISHSDGRRGRRIVIPTATGVAALRCSPLMLAGRSPRALLEVDDGTQVPVGLAAGAPAVTRHPAVAVTPRARPRSDGWPEGQQLLPGQSPAWQTVLHAAAVHRATGLPLVVVGESGTGKL